MTCLSHSISPFRSTASASFQTAIYSSAPAKISYTHRLPASASTVRIISETPSSAADPTFSTIKIPYQQLKDPGADILDKIELGFGCNGLGILSISDVPGYALLRNLLHLAPRLAKLPEVVKEKLEDPHSRYPSYCGPNIWPLGALPELELAFKALGKLILDVGLLLAYHCDRYSGVWIDLITDRSFIESYQKKHDIAGLYGRKDRIDFISYQGFIYWLYFISYQRFIYGKRNKKEFAGYFWQFCTVEYRHYRYRSIFVPFDEKNCDPSVHKWRIPEEMEILAACRQEGIIFCCHGNDYFLGMPAVDKWLIMPEPDDVAEYQRWMFDSRYIPYPHDFVFGMVVLESSPLWYKIVKLAWMSNQLYYQIYDSKIHGWRKAEVIYCSGRPMVSTPYPTISIPGSIYWQTINGYVLVFNGWNDSFHLFSLPYGFRHQGALIHEFNGQIGLSIMDTESEMELWEIDDIKNSTWRKRRDVHVNDIKTRRHGEHQVWYTKEQDETIIHGEYECKCQIFPFGL